MTQKKINFCVHKYSLVSLLRVSAPFVHYPQETPHQNINTLKKEFILYCSTLPASVKHVGIRNCEYNTIFNVQYIKTIKHLYLLGRIQ